MSMQTRELADDEWTIGILGRLEFLLRIYSRSVRYPMRNEIQNLWVEEFDTRGLLVRYCIEGTALELSGRGKRLIEMILATPLPCQVWVDPRKEKK